MATEPRRWFTGIEKRPENRLRASSSAWLFEAENCNYFNKLLEMLLQDLVIGKDR